MTTSASLATTQEDITTADTGGQTGTRRLPPKPLYRMKKKTQQTREEITNKSKGIMRLESSQC